MSDLHSFVLRGFAMQGTWQGGCSAGFGCAERQQAAEGCRCRAVTAAGQMSQKSSFGILKLVEASPYVRSLPQKFCAGWESYNFGRLVCEVLSGWSALLFSVQT